MPDDRKELSSEVDAALGAFVVDGCPGDVNDYLDGRALNHPRIFHRRAARAGESIHEDFVPCEAPLVPTSKWIPDREGGHLFWYCALPK
jgi:hypothetical protein